LQDAILDGVDIGLSLRGLETLTHLQECGYVDPDLRNLGFWSSTWLDVPTDSPAVAKLKRRFALYFSVAASVEKAYARELLAVCESKGTPATKLCRLRWWNYHMAHYSARGVEFLAMTFYSLIGYGERVRPAFLTWLVSVFLVAPVWLGGYDDLLQRHDCKQKTSYLAAFGDALVAPTAVLRLADKTPGNAQCISPIWVTLATVLLATTLGATLLTLRKLVKR